MKIKVYNRDNEIEIEDAGHVEIVNHTLGEANEFSVVAKQNIIGLVVPE